MNQEFEIRKKRAEEINEKIKDLAEGILLVGSVSYNPEAVTEKSDLDMVGVLDFSSVDFEELYRRLSQNFEPLLVKYAKEGKIHNVSIVWDDPQFEVGLHLWDKNAFMRVVNLEKFNLIFRRKDFSRNFKSTADSETLINLKGKEKQFYKDPMDVDGGTILKFFVYGMDKSDFYPGIQICNLLLDPIILSEKDKLFSNGLDDFQINIKKKLIKIYGEGSESINLYNSLALKLKEKVGAKLEKKLIEFF